MRQRCQDSNSLKVLAILYGLLFTIVLCWPSLLPFPVFFLWIVRCNLGQALAVIGISLLRAIIVNGTISLCTKNKPEDNEQAEKIIVPGILISIYAGVSEEIDFRWLYFTLSILASKLANVCTFGLICWLQVHAWGPLLDWLTLGFLREYLVGLSVWPISAAIMAANGKFQDAHQYQGPSGMISSWYGGMFYFYIMLHYGLPIAILAHLSYDLMTFLIIYLDRCYGRHQQHRQQPAVEPTQL